MEEENVGAGGRDSTEEELEVAVRNDEVMLQSQDLLLSSLSERRHGRGENSCTQRGGVWSQRSVVVFKHKPTTVGLFLIECTVLHGPLHFDGHGVVQQGWCAHVTSLHRS